MRSSLFQTFTSKQAEIIMTLFAPENPIFTRNSSFRLGLSSFRRILLLPQQRAKRQSIGARCQHLAIYHTIEPEVAASPAMLSTGSSASRSIKGSLGNSRTSSKDYYRRKAGKRQSKQTAVTSLSSGSSTMYSGGDNQSVISAITMDFFDEDTTVSSSNDSRSYLGYRHGPKLGSMPEQKRASDPDSDEVESYLDQMKHHHSISTNRFSAASDTPDTKMCAMPRRRSSNSESLEYRIDQATLKMEDCFVSEDNLGNLDDPAEGDDAEDQDDITEPTNGCSMRSLQGSLDETDPFQVGLYGDDEGEADDYHQAPMPRQSAHYFDSCITLEGSSVFFDDSFQVGLRDEDDEEIEMFGPNKRSDSEITHKTSNTSSYNQFRTMYGNRRQSSSSMAAMRSGTDSAMFDSSFQLGLLEEEEVDFPDYSEHLSNYNDEVEEKKNDTSVRSNKSSSASGSTSGPNRSNSSSGVAAPQPAIENQSLDLDDIF